MNAEEMMGALDSRAKKVADAQKIAHERNKAEMIANCQRIVEQLQKVREIRPVVMRLFRENLVKYEYASTWCAWITNGVHHNLGFYQTGRGYLDFGKFGIEGGGCSYDSVCVDVDTGLFSRNNGSFDGWDDFLPIEEFAEATHKTAWNAPIRANCDSCAVSGKIAAMVKGIDTYIEKLSAYVASLNR